MGIQPRKGVLEVEVRINSRNAGVSEALRRTVVDKMNRATRVFSDLRAVDVEIIGEANPRLAGERFRIELTGQALGRVIRAEAAAPSPEMALDTASDRFTRRIRRLKEKVIDRHRQTGPPPASPAASAPDEIVRVKRFIIKPMTIDEARLQMEMLGHDFFFFRNAHGNRHSVLYRRRDGRLGLIESGG